VNGTVVSFGDDAPTPMTKASRSAGYRVPLLASRALPKGLAWLAVWYVAGLFAIVAAMAFLPGNGALPVLVLFAAWLLAFFLFAAGVIVWAYALLAVIVYRGLRRVGRKKPLAHPAGGVWDRELDGVRP
jgi:hypothetical protein